MAREAFKLTSKQSQVWHSLLENPQYRRILLDGGARSTKTVLICIWLIKEAAKYAGSHILMARKNRNAAEHSIWQDTLKPLCLNRRGFRITDSTMEVNLSNGSFIRVDGLDDQDRVDKILGTEYAHIFFNEATQISWQTVQIVLSRLAQPVKGLENRKALFDCNPKSQRHWLYKAGILHINPDDATPLSDASTWGREHFTPYDNPYLPQDALKTLESLTGTQRRRLLDGAWCESSGAVYNEFSEDIHVWKKPLPSGWQNWTLVRGIDFGYTNPFVCLCGLIDPDGRLWIFREYYVRQQTVRSHAAAIKKIEPERHVSWTISDHDAEDRATLHECGIITQAARKDIERGIKAVKERLKVQGDGMPRLIICEGCQETISEFYDYAWDAPKEGRNSKEEPIKDRDHAMDTIRYMVMKMDGGHSGGVAIKGMI